MKLLNILTALAGVGVGALGVFVPPLAPFAIPAALTMVAAASPQPSRLIEIGKSIASKIVKK
jgi:hypothetical protein